MSAIGSQADEKGAYPPTSEIPPKISGSRRSRAETGRCVSCVRQRQGSLPSRGRPVANGGTESPRGQPECKARAQPEPLKKPRSSGGSDEGAVRGNPARRSSPERAETCLLVSVKLGADAGTGEARPADMPGAIERGRGDRPRGGKHSILAAAFARQAAPAKIFDMTGMFAAAAFICTPIAVWDGDGPLWCAEGPKIRIAGIAARELDGTCRPGHPCPAVSGTAARDALVALVGEPTGHWETGHITVRGPQLQCTALGESYGRIVARCQLADGGDLASAMIASGTVLRWRD